MDTTLRLLVCLACFGLLLDPAEATSFNEYRKALLSVNPLTLTPQCRIVFQKCAAKLVSMISVLDNVSKRWEEYQSIPCIKKALAGGFPDYTQDCTKTGKYGEGVVCQLTDEVLEVYGDKNKMKPALIQPVRPAMSHKGLTNNTGQGLQLIPALFEAILN